MTIKRTDCCDGQYCRLCWSVLLLHGTMLLLFHGDQFDQSNLHGTIWSSSHPVINNISCCMVQPCWRCLPRCDTKGLWPMHLLWWWLQTDQLHRRRYEGSLLPCKAYVTLERFIVAWQDVHVLVARCSSSSCMTYAVNCPCGKGLIVVLSQLPSLARGSSRPSLVRGLLWPSSTDGISFGVLLSYLPLATYTTSLVYSMYSTLAYLRHWSLHCAVQSLLHLASNNMKFWLLHGSLFDLPLHSSAVVIDPYNMTIRNDCRVVNIVVKLSQSIELLASCAFAIIDVVNPHQWAVCCCSAIVRSHCNQLSLPSS